MQSKRVDFAVNNLQNYSVSKVCRILKIAKSSYYYHSKHPTKNKYTQEECDAVKETFIAHNGSFGRRMLKRELIKIGVNYSERKISGILKQLGVCSKYGRKKCKNVHTSENTEKYIHENLYKQLSKAERGLYEIWSMDFTEEKIKGKKIFTCGIVSVTRKLVVAIARGKSCTAELAIKALTQALAIYGAPHMVMTDRGSAFTSKAFYDIMQKNKILHSMSRPHRPVDNCFIETFWKSMKIEMGKTNHLNEYTYAMVMDYYVYYYNNLRPHSALNYLTPMEYISNQTVI